MNNTNKQIPENIKFEKFGNIWEMNKITREKNGFNKRETIRTFRTKKQGIEYFNEYGI